ncbi:hypothetical protein V6U90_02690 [Micromonospora sp. CPCC 206060]|uniref:hypothetical protein n=1 Tax=Micromonospora sp. CPCC 206060 TaxID=3122406 RepID=UPI002FF40FDF
MSAPPTLPDALLGRVLTLGKEDWRYGCRRLRLRVEQVRHDLSRYYDNEWIWLVGETLGPDGAPQGRMGALVRVAALAATD